MILGLLFYMNFHIWNYNFLTLRRDRGGLYNPPLEEDRRLLGNGAPQARQLSAQLLKFHLPPTSGGPVPPQCRQVTPCDPIVPPNWKCSEFYETFHFCTIFGVECDGDIHFWPKSIFDSLKWVLQRSKDAAACRHARQNAATKLIYVAINFYHGGLLLVQRVSLGAFPILSF